MSVWHGTCKAPLLTGAEGELISVRVSTDPRSLEDLLDCLSGVSFPINPQIYHGVPTVVEFPAFEARLSEVYSALQAFGFCSESVVVRDMLAMIRT
ncbi:MAG: hypothetical protein H7Y20_08730 [Bryobacteraceae bacterium]|nr:hypothetical protein [Bryobacteraceae bacterium]